MSLLDRCRAAFTKATAVGSWFACSLSMAAMNTNFKEGEGGRVKCVQGERHRKRAGEAWIAI